MLQVTMSGAQASDAATDYPWAHSGDIAPNNNGQITGRVMRMKPIICVIYFSIAAVIAAPIRAHADILDESCLLLSKMYSSTYEPTRAAAYSMFKETKAGTDARRARGSKILQDKAEFDAAVINMINKTGDEAGADASKRSLLLSTATFISATIHLKATQDAANGVYTNSAVVQNSAFLECIASGNR